MKRFLIILGQTLFWLFAASVLFSVGSQQFMDKSWGWNMVSGSSMVPTLEQGDYVFILPSIGGGAKPSVGQVIAFRDNSNKAVIHRVVAQTPEGYMTQGDAHDYTDQSAGQDAIVSAKIQGKPLAFGTTLFRVPVIGSLAEKVVKPDMRLPLLAVAIASIVIIVAWESMKPGRGQKRPNPLARQGSIFWKYCSISLIGALVLMSAIIRMSTTENYSYTVSPNGDVISQTSSGANLGGVAVGEDKSVNLGFTSDFPIGMQGIFISQDPSINFPDNPVKLPAGQKSEIETTVSGGSDVGFHTAPVTMMVLPSFLPGGILLRVAELNLLAAMFIASLCLVLLLTVPFGLAEKLSGQESMAQAIRKYRRQMAASRGMLG